MVITRKIEIYVSEDDVQLRKQMYGTLRDWRDNVRRAANAIVAHKFVQQNVRDFVYFTEEVEDKFFISDILKKGRGMSEQNTTYRVCSAMLKGKVPASIFSSLNQAVAKTFKETVGDYLKGKASVRSYKNDIPVPFGGKDISNLHLADDGHYHFTLFGLPLACRLGRDRSNNGVVIERCISGEYKICSSSYMMDDRRGKTYLLLCVDIPKKEVSLKADKAMYAMLSHVVPIRAVTTQNVKNFNPMKAEPSKVNVFFEIGTKEEFLYRRRQIQEALRRCQVGSRYAAGGKGRARKCQAVDRFRDMETNYVKTKMHTYSRRLVDAAVKHECAAIVLVNQKKREEEAKQNPYILRNWSYYSLKQMIEYKAKMAGVKVIEETVEGETYEEFE